MFSKKITTALLLIICTGLLSGCKEKPYLPDVKNLTAKEAWTAVEQLAQASWQPDAKLVQLGSVISNQSQSLDGRPRGWDFFVISEATKSFATFGYVSGEGAALISSGTYGVITDLPMDLLPTIDDWKVDSDEAYTIATLQNKPGSEDSVKYGLQYSAADSAIIWTVSYGENKILINAKNGSVM